jgi:hypothetical protein
LIWIWIWKSWEPDCQFMITFLEKQPSKSRSMTIHNCFFKKTTCN